MGYSAQQLQNLGNSKEFPFKKWSVKDGQTSRFRFQNLFVDTMW